MITNNIIEAIAMSTKTAATAAVGTKSRGKYTLVIRLVLETRLLELLVIAEVKKFHGNNPAYENMA
jgi:hypothetical protein